MISVGNVRSTIGIAAAMVAACSTALAQSGDEALWEACREGETETVRRLLNEGVDPNAMSEDEWTPLMFAAMNGNADIVTILLDAGADPNRGDTEYGCPLATAAVTPVVDEDTSLRVIEQLLKNGALPDKTNGVGMTPLFFAAREGKPKIVRALTKAGADASWRDVRDWTPLRFGMVSQDPEVIRALLDAGANPNHREFESGRTPLHLAVSHATPEIVEILLAKDVDPDGEFNGYHPPTPLIEAMGEGKFEMAEQLLRAGANPNYTDLGYYGEDGTPKTALDWALEQGRDDLAELIREKNGMSGEELNRTYAELREAIASGNTKEFKRLMKMGIDPRMEISDQDSETNLLKVAAEAGRTEFVEMILEYERPFNEWTLLYALQSAGENGHEAVADYMIEHKPGLLAAAAVSEGNLEMLEQILARSKEPLSYRGADEMTLLHTCAGYGDFDFVNTLLSAGADPDALDRWNETALFGPVRNGDESLVRMLAEASDDPKAAVALRNHNGMTPVHAAALAGASEIILVLIEYGAPIDTQDRFGWTPLHYAAERDNWRVANELVRAGADLSIRTDAGKTAEDIAREGGSESVEGLLKESATR